MKTQIRSLLILGALAPLVGFAYIVGKIKSKLNLDFMEY